MAKQIKVIKCPQCGSTKPQIIRPDHYRCDKCGTEFFLDNDDININVNHRHEPTNRTANAPYKGIVVSVVVAVVGLMLLTRFCVNQVKQVGSKVNTYTVNEREPVKRKKNLFSVLLPANGKSAACCLINKNGNTYAVFQDIVTGQLLTEQVLTVSVAKGRNISYRRFVSDNTDYVIINNKHIYKIDPANYVFTDITAEICARKPALESGLISVAFVPEGMGEGFVMHTNLGKELFYFPVADVLYTQKAFKFMTTDNTKAILPGARDIIYYLLLNKESSHSSNVAQLIEITYKFNDGGPENKLMKISDGKLENPNEHRIISYKSITDEWVCFSPEVLFHDQQHILIAWQPTLAKDAGINVQLLDKAGNIVWTVPFKDGIKSMYTIRTNRGFVLQTGESDFCEIDTNGQNVQTYKLP